jgi:prephenate dehydrogenase
VAGFARRIETRRQAIELGAVDTAPATLAATLEGAAVVVLAPPVLAIRDLLRQAGPLLSPGTIVTDVASTKGDVERWAAELLPPGIDFVGGHPMAGKETAGIEFADGDLFRGRTWCIVPPAGVDPLAVARVTELARDTGARTLEIAAGEHDRAVAATSHLPFMVSAALCDAVVTRDDFRRLLPVAGTGLRDLTRLASGDALMHRDICLTNRAALIGEMEAFAVRLAEVTDLLRRLPEPEDAAGDGAVDELQRLFLDLKDARDAWLRS